MPIRWRSSSGLSFSTDLPSSRMSPWSGSISRFITRSSVDLPEPDGPITEAVVPCLDVQVDAAQHMVGPEGQMDVLAVSEPEVNSLMAGLPFRPGGRLRPVPSSPAGPCAGGCRCS